MKSKHKIGEVFNCFGNILVITKVGISSYKPDAHLYQFNYLSKSSRNTLKPWPFYAYYDDSDLVRFKKLEL